MATNIFRVNATRKGKIECTVMENARGMQLHGSLCKIPFKTEFIEQVALCRIGLIDTSNPIHQNPAFSPIIAKRGRIDFVSGDADIETATLEVISCVEGGRVSSMKANPPSGTQVMTLDAGDLDLFQQEKVFRFNAGYMPGYPGVTVSLVNRHYAASRMAPGGGEDGWEEAKHRIYFGQNGSGKTIYLLQHLAARLTAHRAMGCLALDTKGDLIAKGKHQKAGFNFSFHDLLSDGGRSYEMITIDDIRLTSADMIIDELTSPLAKELGRKDDIVGYMLGKSIVPLADDKEIDIKTLTLAAIMESFADLVQSGIGWSTTKKEERESFVQQIRGASYTRSLKSLWEHIIVPSYSGKYTAKTVAQKVLRDGNIILVELQYGSEKRQNAIVLELLESIRREGAKNFKMGRGNNAEVILDEAHRWVPQDKEDNPFSKGIIDSVNTTRAYGISWTFATQRITSIDKNVYAQSHTKFFMKGLFTKADMDNMESYIGETGVSLYQSLQLEGSYFCLAAGQEVNLSSGIGSVAFIGWDGDVNARIKEANPHIWSQQTFTAVTR